MTVLIPGTYDPVTLGHVELIRRAAEEYDEVYAVIFNNPDKTPLFALADRVRMLMLATEGLDNVLVSCSDGLCIDYMREHGIDRLVKGIRNDADRAYEDRMAEWNFRHGGYETVYIEASDALREVSSTEVRRRLASGEDLSQLLPAPVIDFLRSLPAKDEKFADQ